MRHRLSPWIAAAALVAATAADDVQAQPVEPRLDLLQRSSPATTRGERKGETQVKGLGDALAIPDVHVHLYGKSPTKVDRKMGHITATGTSLAQARKRAREARKALDI